MFARGTFLALGALVLASGCGGSSSSNDGGSSSSANDGGGTGACNYPSCVASLVASCAPSGTCTEQTDSATYATNDCYSNGVNVLTSIDSTSGTATVTYKKGTSTCYSIEVAGLSGTSTVTIKNASGAAVATGTQDSNTGVTTVVCPGGQPVTLNSDCETVASGGTTTCTTGTCTP